MKIKDRPEYANKSDTLSFKKDATVTEAVNAMNAKKYGCVIIVNEDNTVAGIVTERDIMSKLLPNKMDPDTTKLSEIMSTDVKVAKEDDNLLDWLRIMSNERFRRLPIVNDNGQVVSMMTQGDFVSYTWPELIDRIKETTKATFASTYQIFFILGAFLIYALIMALFT